MSYITDNTSKTDSNERELRTESSYFKNDLDFSRCSPEYLKIIANNQLLVQAAYPKLIAMIATNKHFSKWYDSKFSSSNNSETKKIRFIVSCVEYYDSLFADTDNKIINVESTTFWKCMIFQSQLCRTQESESVALRDAAAHASMKETKKDDTRNATGSHIKVDDDDHEGVVLQKVERTLKPYRYWSADEYSEANSTPTVESGNRTFTRKRNVWIS